MQKIKKKFRTDRYLLIAVGVFLLNLVLGSFYYQEKYSMIVSALAITMFILRIIYLIFRNNPNGNRYVFWYSLVLGIILILVSLFLTSISLDSFRSRMPEFAIGLIGIIVIVYSYFISMKMKW
jgi:hypothetical protein